MLITIDTDKDNERTARLAIGFLAHFYNLEPSDNEVPEGTSPKFPQGSSTPTAAAGLASTAPVLQTAAAAVTPATGSSPVPPPPPPALANMAMNAVTAASGQPVPFPIAPTAAVVSVPSAAVASVPAEYDSAGLPWDARIHQKAKSKKKDGTWKLQKGIDPAIVAPVVAELAARKIATPASPSIAPPAASATVPPPPPVVGAVPPPPVTVAPQVFLPEGNTVPVPPQQGNAAPAVVPVSNGAPAASVPVPPTTIAGAGGSIVTYRSIIDKMTAGTRENKLTAAKVLEIVINCGCPNLQQLNQMPNVWADVDAKIDLALAGLL